MDTKDTIVVVSLFFAGLTLLVSIIRDRQKNAFELLRLNLEKLERFLETPGLGDLIKFFQKKQPEEITHALTKSVEAAEKLQSGVAQYGSLSKAFAAMKLDEPTFRIHELIESNELLYSRFQQYRASKAFLRKHFVQLP